MNFTKKNIVSDIFKLADIKINGPNPWDLQVLDNRFYSALLSKDSIGLGESYIKGWIDCQNLDEMIFRLCRANIPKIVKSDFRILTSVIVSKLINKQTKSKALENISKHYDLGNKLFESFLDKNMQYTCAYWNGAKNLEEAQINKMDLICKKLSLKPGMTLLDIGCGWGGLAIYAAKKYKVRVLGITISKEQLNYAKSKVGDLPVKFIFCDYRDLNDQFDRIVSVGMFEHVGRKNHRKYMKIVNKCLKPDGRFLLHTITKNYQKTATDPWFEKYIFKNVYNSNLLDIHNAVKNLFVVEDLQNIGFHYYKTCLAWHKNFKSNWQKIKKEYSEQFYRMWTYYLLSGAGGFRAREFHVWQILLSKNGLAEQLKLPR